MTIDKHHYYDGTFYETFIDPALRNVRAGISSEIEDDTTVIDLACGTGALSFLLAEKCKRVLGVELSETMVAHANAKSTLDTDHVRFMHGDASHLPHIKDQEFDYATISMALHEMPHAVRLAVVKEARRISKKTIFADFNVPLPWNFQGVRSRLAEFFAGMDHFKGYRDFQEKGGLVSLVQEAQGTVAGSKVVRNGTVQILTSH